MTGRLSDSELDAFRARGDDTLDPLIATLSASDVPEMLGLLFRTDRIPDDPRFRRLVAAIPTLPVQRPRLVNAGQQLFQLYGPEVLLVLGCYGLPAAYAAAHGVQAIYRARRLKDDPQRRLCETAQMLINVMVPGSLEPEGIGTRSALKVRLMHGLIRRHVRTTERPGPWKAEFGEPINQEDLAGTLLTFSLLVLDGLRKIGVELSTEEELGYLEVWGHIALILGIDPRLVSHDFTSAEALATCIGKRQFRPCAEGRQLTRELVDVTNSLFPIPGYGTSVMRFFLDASVFGVNLAEILDLPPANWTRVLVTARAAQKRFILRWLNRVPGARRRRRALSGFFTQRLILMKRPDKQSPFEIPPGLLERWRLERPDPIWTADEAASTPVL